MEQGRYKTMDEPVRLTGLETRLFEAGYSMIFSSPRLQDAGTALNSCLSYEDDRIWKGGVVGIGCTPDTFPALETGMITRIGPYGGHATADLLNVAMRMRPNRIIIGELTAECAEGFLAAANAGHAVLAAMTADSPEDALARLEDMVHVGSGVPVKNTRRMIANGVDVIVQVREFANLVSISEVYAAGDGIPAINTLHAFDSEGQCVTGKRRMMNASRLERHFGLRDSMDGIPDVPREPTQKKRGPRI